MTDVEYRTWICGDCNKHITVSEHDGNGTLPAKCPTCGAFHKWGLARHRTTEYSDARTGIDYPISYYKKRSVEGPTWKDKGVIDA